MLMPRRNQPMVFDLEWNPQTQALIAGGIAYDEHEAYSTFNVESVLAIIREHLQKGLTVIGHNLISVDIPKVGALPQSWEPPHVVDTMIVAHLVHAHLAELGMLGLGSLTRFYFPTSDWKQEKEDMLLYNGLDCAYNFKLYKALARDMDATEQWHLVPKQQKLARMTSLMQERGVRLDSVPLFEFARKRKEERTADAAEFGFNPNSPKQIQEWLKTEKGLYVANATKAVLTKLRGIDEEIDDLLDYREDSKSLTTWFPLVVEGKGKKAVYVGCEEFSHPHFSATGTAVARFSCADPNFQNIPPRLRRFIIARDPDLELAAFDGSQIENRTVAYIAGDKNMLAAFESGLDFHRLNARNIQMMLQSRELTMEEVTDDQRQQGKTVTHATDYKETSFNLARRLFGNSKRESLDKAKQLQDAFYNAYPMIKRWHSDLEKCFDRGDVEFRNPFGRVRYVYAQDRHEFAKRAAHYLGCSTAADIINLRAIQIWEQLGLIPILIVNYELVYELARGGVGLRLRSQIKEIMELPVPEMNGLIIPTSCKVGLNYGKKSDANRNGLRDVKLMEEIAYAAAA